MAGAGTGGSRSTKSGLDVSRAEPADVFARIAAASADAIISVDEAQRIVFFNRGAEQIFGYESADVIGEPLELLLPHRFHQVHAEHIRDFGRSPQVARRMGERLPISGQRANGDEFPAEASITKMEVDGRLVFTAVLRDMTERERGEQAQLFLARVGAALVSSIELETTLATIVQLAVPLLADWAVLYLVTDGKPRRLALAYADPERADLADRLRALKRVMPATHPGHEAMATLTPLLVPSVDDELLGRVAPDESVRDLVRGMGARSAMYVPLGVREEALGAISLYGATRVFDEEALRLAEELGRRASLAIENARLYQEAQRAVTAREEMLRIVSHDLGNPLSAIFVASKVLRRGLESDAPQTVLRAQVAGIQQAAGQIERLIDDLLDAERIQGGRLRLDRIAVRSGDLMEGALSRMGSLAEEKRVELTIAAGADRATEVLADPDRVQQVFSNLIGNALRFTSAGGRIELDARRVVHEVEFSVEDTGHGIDPEDMPHIFERFYQGPRRLHRNAGLGLPIARGIVEGHGGTIGATSEPGSGSRFRFTLPVA